MAWANDSPRAVRWAKHGGELSQPAGQIAAKFRQPASSGTPARTKAAISSFRAIKSSRVMGFSFRGYIAQGRLATRFGADLVLAPPGAAIPLGKDPAKVAEAAWQPHIPNGDNSRCCKAKPVACRTPSERLSPTKMVAANAAANRHLGQMRSLRSSLRTPLSTRRRSAAEGSGRGPHARRRSSRSSSGGNCKLFHYRLPSSEVLAPTSEAFNFFRA